MDLQLQYRYKQAIKEHAQIRFFNVKKLTDGRRTPSDGNTLGQVS
jgi:hypothetical protein